MASTATIWQTFSTIGADAPSANLPRTFNTALSTATAQTIITYGSMTAVRPMTSTARRSPPRVSR